MKEKFEAIEEKLKLVVEDGEANNFRSNSYSLHSSVNSLHSDLVNSWPAIPDVPSPLDKLHDYINHLNGAANKEEQQKYYQLALGELSVLEMKAELAGAI